MLADTMELGKLEKDQLIQLCKALYELLQTRNVIQVQPAYPQPLLFVPAPNPFVSPFTPSYPTWGTTSCEGTQQERFGVK